MPADQPGAQLEQRLAVPLLQLVEEGAPGRVREGLEHVAHAEDHRQVFTCLSRGAASVADVVQGLQLHPAAGRLPGGRWRRRPAGPGAGRRATSWSRPDTGQHRDVGDRHLERAELAQRRRLPGGGRLGERRRRGRRRAATGRAGSRWRTVRRPGRTPRPSRTAAGSGSPGTAGRPGRARGRRTTASFRSKVAACSCRYSSRPSHSSLPWLNVGGLRRGVGEVEGVRSARRASSSVSPHIDDARITRCPRSRSLWA